MDWLDVMMNMKPSAIFGQALWWSDIWLKSLSFNQTLYGLTPDPDLFLDVVYLHPPLRSQSAAAADHHHVDLSPAPHHAAARLVSGRVNEISSYQMS